MEVYSMGGRDKQSKTFSHKDQETQKVACKHRDNDRIVEGNKNEEIFDRKHHVHLRKFEGHWVLIDYSIFGNQHNLMRKFTKHQKRN